MVTEDGAETGVGGEVGDGVGGEVEDEVGGGVGDKVEDEVGGEVGGEVGDKVVLFRVVLNVVEVVLFRVVVDVIELDVSEDVVGFSDELVIKVDIVLKHLFPPEKFSSVVIVVMKAKQS